MSYSERQQSERCSRRPGSRGVVLGGSGWIGRHLVRHLLHATGYLVECWVRSERAAQLVRGLAADEERLVVRCSPQLAFGTVPRDTSVVVHGASPLDPWDAPGALDTNLALTWRLLDDLSGRTAPTRLGYISSLLVRGNGREAYS